MSVETQDICPKNKESINLFSYKHGNKIGEGLKFCKKIGADIAVANSPTVFQKMQDLIPDGVDPKCAHFINLGLKKINDLWTNMNTKEPINVSFINYIPFEDGMYFSANKEVVYEETESGNVCPVICQLYKDKVVDFQLNGVCYESIFNDIDTIYVFGMIFVFEFTTNLGKCYASTRFRVALVTY